MTSMNKTPDWLKYAPRRGSRDMTWTFNQLCTLLKYWGEILDPDGLYRGDFAKSERVRHRIIDLLRKLSRAGYDDAKLAQAGVVRGVGCIGEMLETMRK